MSDKELYQHKITATKIICWSGASALVCAALPIMSVLATFKMGMLWGGVITMGILMVQLAALWMVWFHKRERQKVEIPLPPFVTENQAKMQQQINELEEQLVNLQTLDRVDRMIEERKADSEELVER